MSPAINYVLLESQHVPAMALLHKEAFTEAWSEESFSHFLQDGCIGVGATYNNNLIGFVLCKTIIDEAEVLTFLLSPQYRGKNIGNLIFTEILSILQNHNIKSVFLEVAEDNIAAQKVYLTQGFSVIGERRNYYRKSNDICKTALVMACKLRHR